MISEDQIIEAAEKHLSETYNDDTHPSDAIHSAFIAGAQWAKEQPVIKPLEWKEHSPGRWSAITVATEYNLEKVSEVSYWVEDAITDWFEKHKTIDKAKSAAQSHCKSRIKQCLI